MKNKKGFTLIELLAVIVILAIIALIAVPVIMNILDKTNKSAFKDTAYGIISAGELYFAERQLELDGMKEDVEFDLSEKLEGIELKGEIPKGTLKVNSEGKVALAIYNGRYCITKGYEEDDVTINDNYKECKLRENRLSDLAVVSTDLDVDSVASCLTDGTECEAGTAFAIKVNKNTTEKFYVINDKDNEITLILNRNLPDIEEPTSFGVEWINKDDYEKAGGTSYFADIDGDGWDDGCNDCSDYGPTTALNALKERTSRWTNIPGRTYTISGINPWGARYYEDIIETRKARLLTLEEYYELEENYGYNEDDDWIWEDVAGWLWEGMESAYNSSNYNYCYWTSTPEGQLASAIYFDYGFNDPEIRDLCGIRPVITLTK